MSIYGLIHRVSSVSRAQQRDASEFPLAVACFTVEVHPEDEVLVSLSGILVDGTAVEGAAHLFGVRLLLVDGRHV